VASDRVGLAAVSKQCGPVAALLIRKTGNRSPGNRKAKLDYETREVVCHLDASAMEVRNGRDESEVETVARAVLAALEATKPPEIAMSLTERVFHWTNH
jgi:hypothetical protein